MVYKQSFEQCCTKFCEQPREIEHWIDCSFMLDPRQSAKDHEAHFLGV